MGILSSIFGGVFEAMTYMLLIIATMWFFVFGVIASAPVFILCALGIGVDKFQSLYNKYVLR